MEEILDYQESEKRTFVYAGFWLRVAATIIDGIVFSAIQYPILYLAGYDLGSPPFAVSMMFYPLQFLYFTLMESSEKRATIGKMAVGIEVTNLHGDKISFGQAAGRYFGKILSAIIFLIGFMMAGWTEKKQALHDKLADTLVLKK